VGKKSPRHQKNYIN